MGISKGWSNIKELKSSYANKEGCNELSDDEKQMWKTVVFMLVKSHKSWRSEVTIGRP